jgi:hypothetical protein
MICILGPLSMLPSRKAKCPPAQEAFSRGFCIGHSMARSRNIKPGFFTNDALADLPALTRLLFIGLWTLVDRDGRIEDRPKKIKAECMPYDEMDPDAALESLRCAGFILRYEVENTKCIQVQNWCKHQNPHIKEVPSTLPAPDKHQTSTVQEQYKTQPLPALARLIPSSLIPDSLSLIPEGKTKTERKRSAPSALVSLQEMVQEGVNEQHAKDWLAARKAKRLPLTPTAWADTKAEAIKARLSVPDAIKRAASNGWAGFKASWPDPAEARAGPVTAPQGPNPADSFMAKMDERAASATKPPPGLRQRLVG